MIRKVVLDSCYLFGRKVLGRLSCIIFPPHI